MATPCQATESEADNLETWLKTMLFLQLVFSKLCLKTFAVKDPDRSLGMYH